MPIPEMVPAALCATGGRRRAVEGLDPAAERALLTLLRDTGHDVIEMHARR